MTAHGVDGDVHDLGAELDLDPRGAVDIDEVALERRALELKARVEREVVGPDLAHAREREVLLLRVEEEAQAVLRQLVLVEIGPELETPDHVVGRDLDRALSDLVVDQLLGRLEDEDRDAGPGEAQLPREEAARDPAPHDDDVVRVQVATLRSRVYTDAGGDAFVSEAPSSSARRFSPRRRASHVETASSTWITRAESRPPYRVKMT